MLGSPPCALGFLPPLLRLQVILVLLLLLPPPPPMRLLPLLRPVVLRLRCARARARCQVVLEATFCALSATIAIRLRTSWKSTACVVRTIRMAFLSPRKCRLLFLLTSLLMLLLPLWPLRPLLRSLSPRLARSLCLVLPLVESTLVVVRLASLARLVSVRISLKSSPHQSRARRPPPAMRQRALLRRPPPQSL